MSCSNALRERNREEAWLVEKYSEDDKMLSSELVQRFCVFCLSEKA